VSGLALGSARALTYLVFPALIWAALRFGPRGATLAITVATGVTLWETTHSVGPFAYKSISHSTLSTQLFIAVTALSTLCLAAVVAEREDLSERLRASRRRLIEATDVERRRLGRNVHDGAQQRLSAVVVRLGLALEAAPPQADPSLMGALDGARTEVASAIDELRDLAHGLRPRVLTERGLRGALQRLADSSAVPVSIFDVSSARLVESVETTAYYVVAEAMANAQKHARASTLGITARVAEGALRVEVVDDGDGGASERSGLGLQELRDRVETAGGRFRVASPDAGGTRVMAELPLGGQSV
jgi:signal transduction histidine kinase